MHSATVKSTFLVVGLLLSAGSHACSCGPSYYYLRTLERQGPAAGQMIFQGRVVSMVGDSAAEVEIVETFVGSSAQPGQRLRLEIDQALCGGRFILGEEWIYRPVAGRWIDICSRIENSEMNVLRLRLIGRAQKFPIETPRVALDELCPRVDRQHKAVEERVANSPASQPDRRLMVEVMRKGAEADKRALGC